MVPVVYAQRNRPSHKFPTSAVARGEKKKRGRRRALAHVQWVRLPPPYPPTPTNLTRFILREIERDTDTIQ